MVPSSTRILLAGGLLSAACSSGDTANSGSAQGADAAGVANSGSAGGSGLASSSGDGATGTPEASTDSLSGGAGESSSSGSSGASSGSGAGGQDGGGADGVAYAPSSLDAGTDGDGDLMVGPMYTTSPDLLSKGAPAGKSFHFTMSSANSKIFTGMDSTLNAGNRHAFMRGIDVYVPAKYKDGTAAPFMVIQDGPGQLGIIKNALDNLTQSTDPTRRLPAFIAIAVANGGGDSIGSERGLEYDTMSERYGQFIQTEVVPAVLADATIKAAFPNLALTADPEGRGTLGCSSGGAAALTMGWFHPEWFRRIVTYSGTLVAQQNPASAEAAIYPLGAWDYHSVINLIGTTPPRPLRVFINANEHDLGAGSGDANHHDWLLANQRTAASLKAQNYHYRLVEGMGVGHCDPKVQNLTLPDTLLWVWRGYPIN
jgi:enterochelin esterase family protein